ncbi:MAG: peptidoglycan-associated lipoprotein Pal [Candidatus Methylomirabilales bacterium]|jgi:peptidoglycan-associated lipoprotein|nr:peptidoglycan-associated lipoprotein Pal [candidate division NC10 bacterium]
MVREARELHRKGVIASMVSWRGPLLGLVLLLPVALLLSGCPKKPEVQTAGLAAVAPEEVVVVEPVVEEEVVVVPEEVVVVETEEGPVTIQDVFFDYDKSVIRPDAREALDEDLRVLNENPGLRVVIEGHCDERGTNEYNLALGERRAKAVRGYLMAGGVDSDRISTISYGEERPFCLGHDETAWQCNRRGHFVVVE